MREYLLVFLVALSVTYLLTVVAREIALRTGAVAQVRDRDVHAEPIPYLGGLAMLGGMTAAYFVARELPFLSRSEGFVFKDAGVVLIAGNGHVRKDIAVPFWLRRDGLAPRAVGFLEPPSDAAVFDSVERIPAAERPDPCAGFKAPKAG